MPFLRAARRLPGYFCTAGSSSIDTDVGEPSGPLQAIDLTCGPAPGPAPALRWDEMVKWKSWNEALSSIGGGGGLKMVTERPGLIRQARSAGDLVSARVGAVSQAVPLEAWRPFVPPVPLVLIACATTVGAPPLLDGVHARRKPSPGLPVRCSPLYLLRSIADADELEFEAPQL